MNKQRAPELLLCMLPQHAPRKRVDLAVDSWRSWHLRLEAMQVCEPVPPARSPRCPWRSWLWVEASDPANVPASWRGSRARILCTDSVRESCVRILCDLQCREQGSPAGRLDLHCREQGSPARRLDLQCREQYLAHDHDQETLPCHAALFPSARNTRFGWRSGLLM